MPTGVYPRSLEHRQSISNTLKGHAVTEKTRKVLSEKMKERHRLYPQKGIYNPNTDMSYASSPEFIEKVRRATKAVWQSLSLEARKTRLENHRKSLQRPEVRRKISERGKGRNPSKATRRKLSVSNTGHSVSESTRKAVSRSNARRLMAGDIYGVSRGVTGRFVSEKSGRSFYYRSHLELKWFKRIEAHPRIHKFEVETLVIPYLVNGNSRLYVPDVRVWFVDGTSKVLEIKPRSQWRDSRNVAKWASAKVWCRKRGMVFQVVADDFVLL